MKYFLLISLLSAIISTCDDKESPATPCSCPENLICTEEYRTISLEIRDASGKAVSLDDYYTTKISNGEKIELKEEGRDSIARSVGFYPVLEDKNMQIVDKCGEQFEFIGIKNDVTVVKEILTVKNNCCHIELIKGKTKVVLQ